ncbi:MAG: helix-hairpin-helix domain-containing protein [Geobacteraceae bacterium]|nr:helix-hairpin-helix domain-containing protein [Geobacteraceae bacterium]
MKLYRVVAAAIMLTFVGTVCNGETKPAPKAPKAVTQQAKPASKVDLNTASQSELEKLPGVGPAIAKKIVAGRPYTSTADLAKAGVPAKTVKNITPLVTVAKTAPAAATPAKPPKTPAPVAVPAKPPKAPSAVSPAKAAKPATPPPAGKDMVWVNTETKIYHKAGSQWYGKTKKGSYMTESEAIKAGFRETRSKTK